MSKVTEILKIIFGSILIAIAYGIFHDIVTAHTYLPYFTIFHPHIIDSNSPIAMALLWGVIATWWMGAFIGIFLAIFAQMGAKPRIPARQVLKNLVKASVFVFVVAMVTLVFSLLLCVGNSVDFQPNPEDFSGRFLAVLITHNVSYDLSALVAIGLCVSISLQRTKLSKRAFDATHQPLT
jgi:hypothetical protein